MSEWKQKRFWTGVSVQEAEGGWDVRLDGRPVKTPAKAPLVLPGRGMADAVAAEWADQEGEITPATMPFTRSANAAIDKVRIQQDEVVTLLADYGDSDLLCYRADAPEGLVARQSAGWDPLLDWAATDLGARLEPRTGLMHSPQDADALATLKRRVAAMTEFQLAGFHDLVTLSGSLVLSLAVAEARLSAEIAWDLSRIDEAWQAEHWGEDEEAAEHAALRRAAFLHARSFFRLA